MPELLTLRGHGVHALVASRAVTRIEYKEYLRVAGLPAPPQLARSEAQGGPVIWVSQIDAAAYCRWLGQKEGQPYRLPTMAELLELAGESNLEGVSAEIWPHEHGNRPELRGGMKEMYLCEWTSETEVVRGPSQMGERVLGSIFYPPWLRPGNNAVQVQAHFPATEGYSFVTFRVARGA